jgi:hypothetical protein
MIEDVEKHKLEMPSSQNGHTKVKCKEHDEEI